MLRPGGIVLVSVPDIMVLARFVHISQTSATALPLLLRVVAEVFIVVIFVKCYSI